MSTNTVIDLAAKRSVRTSKADAMPPLWTRTADEKRAEFAPTVKSLPFASSEWTNDWWPESMWSDQPTGDYPADYERGKQFAVLTLGAFMADRCNHGRALAVIFEAIIDDAVRRRAKGGKGSRTMPGAVRGYLEVLADFIVGQCRRPGPPAA